MAEIKNIDLEGFITEAVTNVFDMMLSMETQVFVPGKPLELEGNRIVAAVGFSGDVVGALSIQLKHDFARLITAKMLGMESEEIEGLEEIKDVIGELGNMIGGSVKSRFCDHNLPCVLSIPSITYGINFKVSTLKGARQERFYYRHQQDISLVDLYLKNGS